ERRRLKSLDCWLDRLASATTRDVSELQAALDHARETTARRAQVSRDNARREQDLARLGQQVADARSQLDAIAQSAATDNSVDLQATQDGVLQAVNRLEHERQTIEAELRRATGDLTAASAEYERVVAHVVERLQAYEQLLGAAEAESQRLGGVSAPS